MRPYSDFLVEARQRSLTNGYAAVVTVHCYFSGKSHMSVMSGRDPIITKQRGNSFVAVECQFHNGKPV